MKLNREQQAVVEANVGLVPFTIKRYLQSAMQRMEFEDIVSIGYDALCKAAEKYKLEKGNSFSTYAVKAIVRNVHKALAFNARLKRGAGCVTVSFDDWMEGVNEGRMCSLIGCEPDFSDRLIEKIAFEPVWEICATHKKMYDSPMNARQIAKANGISTQSLFTRRSEEFAAARVYITKNELDIAI